MSGGSGTQTIFQGLWMMVACAIFYLIWWGISFRPEKQSPYVLELIFLLGTAFCGILSVYLLVQGNGKIERLRKIVPQPVILIAGIVTYILLLMLSLMVFKRMVTTELFLIVGWAVVTMITVNSLYGNKIFSKGVAILFVLLTIGMVAASMYCYLIYYQLEKWKAYVDGFIPLALVGIEMAILALVMMISQYQKVMALHKG